MAKYPIEKVETGNPDQCQGIMSTGQCHNKKVPGSDFCPIHGGNKAGYAQSQKDNNMYRLAKYRDRLDSMNSGSNLKSLNEEIGILRILLEEIINQIKTPAELLAFTPQISDLTVKIEKLVTSCHKLEKSLSKYLDKTSIVQLAQETVAIIGKYVNDSDITLQISEELAEVINRMENTTDL